MKVRPFVLVCASALVVVAGCKHCGKRPCPPGPGNVIVPAAPAAVVPPPPEPVAQVPSGPAAQNPPPAWPNDPGSARNYPPQTIKPGTWEPGPQGAKQPSNGVQLKPPANPTEPPERKKQATEASPTPKLPASLPQFAFALDQVVASGLKPFPDGWDWLKANGYKTVLHVHLPGEDDSADKAKVEKLGMKFVSIPVSSKTLTEAVVNEFNQTVARAANQPAFVYDEDGMLAGSMWYIYFRTVDRLPDADATLQASRLGLKENQGDQTGMWVAIHKYLAQRQ